jgi:hypothetical protein
MVPKQGYLDGRMFADQRVTFSLPFSWWVVEQLVIMEGSTFFEVAAPRAEKWREVELANHQWAAGPLLSHRSGL